MTVRLLAGGLLCATLPFAPLNARQEGPENVRLVFQLIEADGFSEVDPAIGEVVDQLQRLFRFEGYRLATTSVLSGTISRGVNMVSQVSQNLAVNEKAAVKLTAWLYKSDNPAVVRISVQLFDANRQTGINGRWVNGPKILDVSVNVRDGQTVVLGSARHERASAALILVMRAEFDPQ
jgi:hypothetical protein